MLLSTLEVITKYDKILGKEKFVAKLKEVGVEDEKIEETWNKYIRTFDFSMFKAMCEQLPSDMQKNVSRGVDFEKEEDVKKLIERVQEYVKVGGVSMDNEKLAKRVEEIFVEEAGK